MAGFLVASKERENGNPLFPVLGELRLLDTLWPNLRPGKMWLQIFEHQYMYQERPLWAHMPMDTVQLDFNWQDNLKARDYVIPSRKALPHSF